MLPVLKQMPKGKGTVTLKKRGPKKGTATGVTGVTITASGKYQPRIRIKGVRYDLGSYESLKEAKAVYANARRTGVPTCNYMKREYNPEHIVRGTGTRARPHIARPVILSDCCALLVVIGQASWR